MDRFEVVVIGAGLSGLWCARSLSRRGVRVLLVDAKQKVDLVVQTTGIFVRRTVEEYVLPTGVLGTPIRRVVLYSPRRRKLEMDSAYDEFWVADMRALYRSLLADCLRHGVIWQPQTRYRGLELVERSLIVNVGDQRVQARFVVGADGARSKVARDLGLSTNTHFLVGLEDVFEGLPEASPPALHCFFDPAVAPGYIAWIVHSGCNAHVGTAGDFQRLRAHTALRSFSAEAVGVVDLAQAKIIERRAGLIPIQGMLKHIACARGLLVGDAAGAPSPLTAGGLDPCLRLTERAVDALTDALTQHNASLVCGYNNAKLRHQLAERRWLRRLYSLAGSRSLELAHAAMRLPLLQPFGREVFFSTGPLARRFGLRWRGNANESRAKRDRFGPATESLRAELGR